MKFPRWLFQLGAPKGMYLLVTKVNYWLVCPTFILLVYGLIGALYLAPPDYQQGDGFRIIYIHVPCAILSLGIYTAMAFFAVIAFVWHIKLYDYLIAAAAPVGALMTFLALVTGSIWGKPMWGTYWIWDARLTSEFIQFFLYIGVIALQKALAGENQGEKLVRILVILGFINIPIIHFSVNWWNTLHQGTTLKLLGTSLIAPSMLHPLLAMIIALSMLSVILIGMRLQNEILDRDAQSSWIEKVI